MAFDRLQRQSRSVLQQGGFEGEADAPFFARALSSFATGQLREALDYIIAATSWASDAAVPIVSAEIQLSRAAIELALDNRGAATETLLEMCVTVSTPRGRKLLPDLAALAALVVLPVDGVAAAELRKIAHGTRASWQDPIARLVFTHLEIDADVSAGQQPDPASAGALDGAVHAFSSDHLISTVRNALESSLDGAVSER